MRADTLVQDVLHQGTGQAACSIIMLRQGACLAVTHALIRFARDCAALDDPLGNGVRGVLDIPPALAPQWIDGSGYVAGHGGGAILLHGGSTLLIKPFAIELYATPADALHARDCHGCIDLQNPAQSQGRAEAGPAPKR